MWSIAPAVAGAQADGMRAAWLVWLLIPSALCAAAPAVFEVGPRKPFQSVQAAIDAAPADVPLTIIRVFPGSYREKIRIPKDRGPLFLQGKSAETTTIVWGDGASTKDVDGKEIGTFNSASVTVDSNDFSAEGLTFSNDFGVGSQAVAVSLGGDRAVFRNCRLTAMQDTLLLRKGRSYFENCYISGTVDFIFGDGASWFESCHIHCRGNGYLTAASTPENQDYGFVFHRCRVTADPEVKRTYLGRPWRPFASVIFTRCELPEVVSPDGWENWRNPENEKTARYAEWRNSGPGANPSERVPWSRQLSDPEGRALRPWVVLRKWDPASAVSAERIARLPQSQQAAWWDYLERSHQALEKEQQTLLEEMKSAGLEAAIRPPDKGKLPSADHPQSWFRSDEGRALTDAVISFQTPAGGWSKAIDYTRGPRKPGMNWSAQGSGKLPRHYVGTIDNGASTSEIRFLAAAYGATRRKDAKDAVERGLEYLFSARYPSGGWPQVWPLEDGYHQHVTFNDDAMLHVLELLNDVAAGDGHFGFVSRELRKQAAADFKAGVGYILASQVRMDGKPAVWCAQHDALDMHPTGARMQEPPSLSSYESATILEFLMKLPRKNREISRAIEGGIDWFERSKVTGIRREQRDGRNFYAEGTGDREPWWGRFYDLERNVPIFSGAKDGRIYDSFRDLFVNNPTEYQYYTTKGRQLLSAAR